MLSVAGSTDPISGKVEREGGKKDVECDRLSDAVVLKENLAGGVDAGEVS